jgi:periplasmic protein TonB
MERPTKVHAGTPTAFDAPRFGAGLRDNLKEFFHAGPRGKVESGLLVNWSKDEEGLWRNLRDWIAPPKLPPLKTTSQPIAVPEIWSKNRQFSRVQLVSIVGHIVFIALIVIVPLWFAGLMPQSVTKAFDPGAATDVSVSPFRRLLHPSAAKAGGGGGQHDKLPATKGKPPKFSLTQFAAPSKPILHPQLAMTPTVVGNPNIVLPSPNLPNWGDPLGKSINDSMGQGHGSGLGNGNGAGVGPGEGWNTGGGFPNAGAGGYGTPQCLYCPHAEYSDEAMKVKVQGVVELIGIVTPDGRVTDVHVVKGLGLGLDEKAIEAVRTWRLRPAPGPDGKPAAVRQLIEVQFQLF